MTYKQALALKKAGFPQEGKGYYLKPSGGRKHLDISDPDYNLYAYEPLLEEILEECKGKFLVIEKLKDGWGANDHYYRVIGKTSLEAVANLYIKINSK